MRTRPIWWRIRCRWCFGPNDAEGMWLALGDCEKTLYPDMLTCKTQALVPDTLVKLNQGFGRLIRKEGDSGVCAILDSWVCNGALYHDRVVAALQGFVFFA